MGNHPQGRARPKPVSIVRHSSSRVGLRRKNLLRYLAAIDGADSRR
jgi:hypothetical protein